MKSNIEFLYEELRKATDGGSESMTHDDALKQIAYWRDKCSQAQAVEPAGCWLERAKELVEIFVEKPRDTSSPVPQVAVPDERAEFIKKLRDHGAIEKAGLYLDAADMLEADAQLHTEIADSRRYIWDMKTSHSKEMRELLLAGSPATAMNPAEVMSIAYDTGCMPEQCTDASLLRFAHVIRVQAQQVAVPDGYVLVPLIPTPSMIVAGRNAPMCTTAASSVIEDYIELYKAMLAAAPQLPQGDTP